MTSADDDSELLLSRLSHNARQSPDKLAIAFLDGRGEIQQSLSYRELEVQTTRLAQQLLKKLKAGDRAMLVYPPSIDFMVCFLACCKAGIVAVPVVPPNPTRRNTLGMFATICSDCHATVALTNRAYKHATTITRIREALRLQSKNRKQTTWPQHLEWIVTDSPTTSTSTKSTMDTPQDKNDLCFLQYTSGSTSDPKGVQITHGNLAHNLKIITRQLEASNDAIVVSWLPQYHDMGLIGSYLGVLYCGGSGYYLSPLSFLQRPAVWVEASARYRATHLQAPNFAFMLTARKYTDTAKTLDLSSIRHAINAAEPVDEASMERFEHVFCPYGLKPRIIFPTYGLAEHTVFVCSATATTQRLTVSKDALEVDGKVQIVAADEKASVPVSRMVGCGVPAREGVDVQIVDPESFQSVGPDTVGEIWVRSPSKAAGYFGKPQESQDDFHAKIVGKNDSDGYLRTGDLGFLHQDELFICGRIKDLIIVGGRNYYPQDIESTAEAASVRIRPGCSAAFTIDTTHEGGEEVALVMELREVPTNKNDVESVGLSLSNQIRSAISHEHALSISEIVFLQPRTVPKTSSGKIARSWCRKAFVAGTLKEVYRRPFKTTISSSLEIDEPQGVVSNGKKLDEDQIAAIRAMSKEEILAKLTNDVSRVGSIPPESIDKNAALVTMMDSLTITQFKGLLESHYAVKLSDEYLFRESTKLTKLVEVVKLGYAPDDGDGQGAEDHAATAVSAPGQAKGLAGALGCPPGVRCVIL